jgi:hypothetical protein
MTITTQQEVTEATRALRELLGRIAQSGIYAWPAPITVGGYEFSIEEVEGLVSALPEQSRLRVRTRLGLGEYASQSRAERNAEYVASFGMTAPTRSELRLDLLQRNDQMVALAILAAQMVSRVMKAGKVDGELGPYERWTTDRYSSRLSFPDYEPTGDVVGDLTTYHERTIRPKIEGLREFRLIQKSNWPSAKMPAYSCDLPWRVEKATPFVNASGVPGFRWDFVIDLPAAKKGEPIDLVWERTYALELGDTFVAGEWDSIDLTPQMPVIPLASMQVQFPAARLPKSIFYFDNVPQDDRLQEIETDFRLVAKNGLVSRDFQDVRQGYSSGIRWRW